ncbi:hypothetical protein L6R46_19025 [Myxococcota bacterium]|nr:hypothetical protein [Myxococcota bacterium]
MRKPTTYTSAIYLVLLLASACSKVDDLDSGASDSADEDSAAEEGRAEDAQPTPEIFPMDGPPLLTAENVLRDLAPDTREERMAMLTNKNWIGLFQDGDLSFTGEEGEVLQVELPEGYAGVHLDVTGSLRVSRGVILRFPDDVVIDAADVTLEEGAELHAGGAVLVNAERWGGGTINTSADVRNAPSAARMLPFVVFENLSSSGGGMKDWLKGSMGGIKNGGWKPGGTIDISEEYNTYYASTTSSSEGYTYEEYGSAGSPGASGDNGRVGDDGVCWWGTAVAGTKGAHGDDGERGRAGRPASPINLKTDQYYGGTFIAEGGAGGKGGAGGAGGDGGDAVDCLWSMEYGQEGGDGGDGGDGSDGGAGGDVTVIYGSTSAEASHVISTSGGNGGAGGHGGARGVGGASDGKAFGGVDGTKGASGDDGADGAAGVVNVGPAS